MAQGKAQGTSHTGTSHIKAFKKAEARESNHKSKAVRLDVRKRNKCSQGIQRASTKTARSEENLNGGTTPKQARQSPMDIQGKRHKTTSTLNKQDKSMEKSQRDELPTCGSALCAPQGYEEPESNREHAQK